MTNQLHLKLPASKFLDESLKKEIEKIDIIPGDLRNLYYYVFKLSRKG